MYDTEGYLLDVFERKTYTELEKKLGLASPTIGSCIDGTRLHSNNLQFRKVTDACQPALRIGDISKVPNVKSYDVIKYYKGKYIKTYDSPTEASRLNKLSLSSIVECCNGNRKTAGGFQWRYAQDLTN